VLSCGQSDAEAKAMEQRAAAQLDSLKAAIKAEAKAEAEAHLANKEALSDSLSQLGSWHYKIERNLTEARGDEAALSDRMERVKQVQLGRTPAEREIQIREATMALDETRKRIDMLSRDLERIVEIEERLKIRLEALR
jgi:hypothetical protein